MKQLLVVRRTEGSLNGRALQEVLAAFVLPDEVLPPNFSIGSKYLEGARFRLAQPTQEIIPDGRVALVGGYFNSLCPSGPKGSEKET